MSIQEQISSLVPYVEREGLPILRQVEESLARHLPDWHAERLNQAIDADEDTETLKELAENLEMALARYHRPALTQTGAYKTDMKRFFELLYRFIEMGRLDGARQTMDYYSRVFTPGEKIMCGTPVRNCSHRNEDGSKCGHQYGGETDLIICPDCDKPRPMCKQRPNTNGRCRYHGGELMSGVLAKRVGSTGRGRIYANSLNGKLQEMYIEAVSDPEYLSLAPEIAALAARAGQIMSNLGDTDYMVVKTGIDRAVKRMRDARDDDDMIGMIVQADTIVDLLEAAATDQRRWDELGEVATRLARIASEERRRVVDAQRTITVQEMYQLRQETLAQIRDASNSVANVLYLLLKNGRAEDISPAKIRRKFLSTLYGIMNGDIRTENLIIEDDVVDGDFEEASDIA